MWISEEKGNVRESWIWREKIDKRYGKEETDGQRRMEQDDLKGRTRAARRTQVPPNILCMVEKPVYSAVRSLAVLLCPAFTFHSLFHEIQMKYPARNSAISIK